MTDLGKVFIRQHRCIQTNLTTALRFRVQQVSRSGPIVVASRRYDLFTNRIDWRIGYLSEHLFESNCTNAVDYPDSTASGAS